MSDRPFDACPFFVVGCERSGTTLVRLMLDSHPHLAVPPESHFVVQGPGPREDLTAAIDRILTYPSFHDWDLCLDREQIMKVVADRAIGSYAELLRCLYGLFAEAHGKRRWGDKTPRYVHHIPALIALFPDAQFIHVIRNGYETAASFYQHGRIGSVISAADWWRRVVAEGRRARRLGSERYYELRLERLIANPAAILEEVCQFLGEPFSPVMLEYHRDARLRLTPQMLTNHQDVERPPTSGLRDWTAGLSYDDQIAVQAVCARTMRSLGFPVSRPPLRGYVIAGNHMLRTWAGQLLHPEWRPGHIDAPAQG
jgi:hypothetical protein